MPVIWGPFESSLRSRIGPGGEDLSQKKIMHKTCSGHAHGHGVRKEKVVVEKEKGWREGRQIEERVGRERRQISLPPESSSDESTPPSANRKKSKYKVFVCLFKIFNIFVNFINL